MAGEAGGSEAGPSEQAAFRFLDLPPEVQLGIIAQVCAHFANDAVSQSAP